MITTATSFSEFYIQLTRDVKTPSRAYDTDAGIDFYVPNVLYADDLAYSKQLTGFDCEIDQTQINGKAVISSIEIKPHEALVVPSGVKICVPAGFAFVFFNKSGIATKRHLMTGACIVDHGYTNEVHLHMVNTAAKTAIIRPGDKIVQGVLMPISMAQPRIVDDISTYGIGARGDNGFGSTAND